jgi:hypothetical protein
LPAEVSIDPDRLARLPLAFLVEQDVDFDIDGVAGNDVAAYREVMTAGLRLYQLYSYQGMVRRRFGERVAKKVHALQCRIIDSEQAGAGEAVDAALQLIELSLSAAVFGAEAGSVEFPVPAEQCVALALLTGLPESPDYLPDAQSSDRHLRCIANMEQQLAGLLVRGKQDMLRTFSPLFRSRCSP